MKYFINKRGVYYMKLKHCFNVISIASTKCHTNNSLSEFSSDKTQFNQLINKLFLLIRLIISPFMMVAVNLFAMRLNIDRGFAKKFN